MSDLLQFTLPPVELIIRGSAIYLGLLIVLRFVLRRDVSSMGTADVLFIVLIADASQNAMAGEYRSIADGATLIGTLVFWNVLLDWLAYRSPSMRRVLEPRSLPLISDGKWIRKNLKREWITTEEVLAKLREQGIEDIESVRRATLEASGEIGVIIMRDTSPSAGPEK